MLQTEHRLKKKKEFDKVFKYSKPVHSKNLSLRYTSRVKAELPTRIGFVISNKIDKRSTKRNSLKRALREIFRSLISDFPSGYDVVVIVKENYSFPYDQELIKNDVIKLLSGTKLNSNDKNYSNKSN